MKEYLDEEPLIIERGEGVRLFDVRGRAYYDGNASVWLNVHGHNRKELNEAISEQLEKIAHSTLLGMANVPAIELAERLVRITPPGLTKCFIPTAGRRPWRSPSKWRFFTGSGWDVRKNENFSA